MDATEVLIVGAGPTGLMLACALARHGVRPRIVDKASAPSEHSKALGIHARTMEILDAVGLVERFLERGRRLEHMEVRSGSSRLAHLSMEELDSPYPFVLILEQSETERLLEEHLARQGIEVERGLELRSFVDDAGGVVSRLGTTEGNRRVKIESRWLVGCDGAHSTVRKLLGLAWDGVDLPGNFLLLDAELELELPDDHGTVFFSPDGTLGFIPLPRPGWWRIVAALAEEIPDTSSVAALEALIERRTDGLAVRIVRTGWLSQFEIRQRKVVNYSQGRAFVAGDAAHAHSPVGGQGMNTGMQDAWNLAWKLALVSQGAARGDLLDSYGLEREPVARALLQGTARGTRLVTLRSPLSRALRNQVARFVGNLDVVQQRMARAIGETAIHYRQSPIVGEDRSSLAQATFKRSDRSEDASLGAWRDFNAAPRAGERAPDAFYGRDGAKRRVRELTAGPAHALLLFDGHAPTDAGYANLSAIATQVGARYGEHVRCHVVIPGDSLPDALSWRESVLLDPDFEVHERFGAAAECLYLVRPDGYIGYRSQPARAETLIAWLERIFV